MLVKGATGVYYSHSWYVSVVHKPLVLLSGYNKKGHHFTDEIFELIFLYGTCYI